MFRSNSSPSYSSLSSASPTPSSSPSLQYSQAAASTGQASPLPKYPSEHQHDYSSSSPASSNKGGNESSNSNSTNTQDNFNAASLHQLGQALASQGISIPPKFQFKPNFHESFALAKSQFAAMLKPPEIVITESKSDNLIDYDVEPGYSNDTDRSTTEIKDHK